MTRILQIRRGTTEQNNNFTGLAGEITMDTDAKTIRIHDGETVGGIVLARADNKANCSGTCDITAIPDDFWENIIIKYSRPQFTKHETRPVPINSHTSRLEYNIDNVGAPAIIQSVLICQNPDAGYSTGDEVCAFGVGTRCAPQPNWAVDETGLHLNFMVANQQYWVSHKETGETIYVADENWRILFRVYC